MDDPQLRDPESTDLSALSWVHGELKRSLEAAHKALRRYLKEAEASGSSDVDAVDPSILRQARASLHQGVGALELVGMPAAAQLLRASEAAVQRLAGRPRKFNLAAVETVERGSFALLDYLSRLLAAKPVSALALFPSYRALQELAGADRVHPADLWEADWQWLELPADPAVPPRAPDAQAVDAFEASLLALMRQQPRAAGRIGQLCAELAEGARGRVSTLWRLAGAFFEGQAAGLIRADVYGKRLASRLLAQLRLAGRGEDEVSERLAQDLLFFCDQAGAAAHAGRTPRLAAVRDRFGLSQAAPVDYEEARLGRFDPALLAQARKRVASAQDTWSAVAGGELHRLGALPEQFSLVGDSLRRLMPGGVGLADALLDTVQRAVATGEPPPAPLAMEVATAVLYLDAVMEDGELDGPEQAERSERLASRLREAVQGHTPPPLEPWMEELYRRVSDRQTMGSVVQELRGALAETEKLIDQFFREPTDSSVLIPVPGQLSAMRGVLSVLGLEQASQAVLRMRDDVDGLASTQVDPERAAQAGTFDRLAGNLGALGFLIDMLNVQPQMAKSLFRFDAQAGVLSSTVGGGAARLAPVLTAPAVQEERLIEQARELAVAAVQPDMPLHALSDSLAQLTQEAIVADQSGVADAAREARAAVEQALEQVLEHGAGEAADAGALQAAREQVQQALDDLVEAAAPPAPLVPAPLPPLSEDEAEMRDIFLEEAREVVHNAAAARQALGQDAADLGELTALRRAFHTLKGSSRMVGLSDFGEAAWACEQLYNARLADAPRADEPLLAVTDDALAYLGDWVEAIAAGEDRGHRPPPVQALCDALRLEGRRTSLALPMLGAAVEPPAVETAEAPDFALDLAQLGEPVDEPLQATEPMPLPELVLDGESGEERPDAPAEAVELIEMDFGGHAEFDLEAPIEAAEVLGERTETLEAPLAVQASAEAAPAPLALDLDIEAVPAPVLDAADALAQDLPPEDLEQVKVVGPLRIAIPLFNIYLQEADEQSRRLATELAEWALELHRPVGETAIALAHSLAGNSATVGFHDLSHLARLLEHALMRVHALGVGEAAQAALFNEAAEEIRRLLHQFAAGFLKAPSDELLARLVEAEQAASDRHQQATAAADPATADTAWGTDEVVSVAGMLSIDSERPVAEAPAPAVEPVAEAEPPAVEEETPALTGFDPLQALAPQFGTPELLPLQPLAVPSSPAREVLADTLADDEFDAVDAVDADLFPIFEEEAQDLLPELAGRLREWHARPADAGAASACMRTLHTFKGGARLAGAMRLGEMAHRLESAIERLLAQGAAQPADIEPLQARGDAMNAAFEALRHRDAQAYAEAQAAAASLAEMEAPATMAAPLTPAEPVDPAETAVSPAPSAEAQADAGAADAAIDWARFAHAGPASAATPAAVAVTGAVRVRTPLLDRLVNHAGEVTITRSRIESAVGQLKGSLGDLTDNLERLRRQLRDIELQAETQIASRMEAAKAASQDFDPLEMDRFTRFQELTRMMAESVNDVATVQRALQRTLQSAEDELAAQARLTRDLQDDLLRTRMVEFEGLSDRLYRVVRQAAKETGKQVRLDLVGGAIEVDRGVLDRMTAAFEHLLRNSVTHGIETPAQRVAAGKEPTGQITVALAQEGNEVGIEFRDDGGGLNLDRIRQRGIAQGLIDAAAMPSQSELLNLIFMPGFSTADQVTELAGRGVGMDVVRAEVNAMGGRIETASAAGQGTSFRLVLPLTTAVTQVVMLRCGATTVAVPSSLIEIVRRATPTEVEAAYDSRGYTMGDSVLPFFWLGALLQASPRGTESGRTVPVVIVRSAQQRVALHVDEVLGNQEVVVKNLGPQLSRLPGLAGLTLLASGSPALIYNPVALAALYGEMAWAAMAQTAAADADAAVALPVEDAPRRPPLVLVVDDSLTVRRVTQRLLLREGFRVTLAKDGLEGLERLAEELPTVVLSDIEMPRMDGFDLVRNMRADARWRELPVIMITSRIAQKHRDHAAELGVEHYLGKPYSEEDLLALLSRYNTLAPV